MLSQIFLVISVVCLIVMLIGNIYILYVSIRMKIKYKKFYREKYEIYKLTLNAFVGEIIENGLLYSLRDKYFRLKKMLDEARDIDDLYMFLDELLKVSNEASELYDKKILELPPEERGPYEEYHKKYKKAVDDTLRVLEKMDKKMEVN